MSRLREADAARRADRAASPDFSEALARGLQVITAFNAENRALSLSELARSVDLPRATARRILLTLVHLGYVTSDGRLFRLAPRVLRLATAYLTSNTISMLLQPACDRIMRRAGESCTAAVLEGPDVVMVARALPAQLVPAGAGIGFRLPAYCTALGRVLLSGLPAPDLNAYLAGTPLLAVTDHTATDAAAVRRAVQAAAADGFCFVDQEAEHGFRSVAVPLRRFDGTLVAALNVGARIERADGGTMLGQHLPMLREEAAALTGYLI